MKKAISIITALMLIISTAVLLTACKKDEPKGQGTTDPSHVSESEEKGATETDAEAKKLFDEATKELTGASYTTIAYLGTNEDDHVFLAEQTVTVPDATKTYAIVKISEKDGKAEIKKIISSAQPVIDDTGAKTDGGWAKSGDLAVTDEAKAALEKASETLTGATYNPVALLGTQIVAGTKYMLVCEMTATVPDAKTDYAIVTVYADLEGNAEIEKTIELVDEEENAEIANPVAGYETKEEAAKAVGFDLETPDLDSPIFSVIGDEIFEIGNDDVYVRKAKGSDDISGDYNDYSETLTETVQGKEVTFKGNDGKINLLLWTEGDFSFCVGFNKGVSRADAESYIGQVK